MNTFAEDTPEYAARRFVEALAWGEHRVVWKMFSSEGRRRIVEIGTAAGLDRVMAERITSDIADETEMDEFLSSLMHGLRADFENLSSDKLTVEPTDLKTDASALVDVSTPGFTPAHRWPIGQFQMVRHQTDWFVESFKPHRTLS